MMILLLLTLGIGGLAWVAIAPQLFPQFQPLWLITHQALDLTLGNMGRFENRISLLTWYLSSVLVLAAMLCFNMAALSSSLSSSLSGPHPGPHPGAPIIGKQSLPKRQVGWITLGIGLLLFSADKSTGLHHALIHDVLYRFPLATSLKKQVVLVTVLGLFSGFLFLVQPIWRSLCQPSKGLLAAAGLCFMGSVGIEGVTGYFFTAAAWSAHALLFLLCEQCIDQLAGLLLVFGLLWHLQKELGARGT